MKKSVKKMQLKKRSISVLNSNAAKGGLQTTWVITALPKTLIYIEEDICFTERP